MNKLKHFALNQKLVYYKFYKLFNYIIINTFLLVVYNLKSKKTLLNQPQNKFIQF